MIDVLDSNINIRLLNFNF